MTDLEFVPKRNRHDEQHDMLERHHSLRNELKVHFVCDAQLLSPPHTRQLTPRVRDGFRWKDTQQVTKPDDRSGFATAACRAEKKCEALRRRPTAAAHVVSSMLVIIGLVEISDAVVRQTRPIADGVGPRRVRNHTQRQVVALEVAIVTMTPYAHPVILRPRSIVANRNWT